MNFSISSSDLKPGAPGSGIPGYKVGVDTTTPIAEKRSGVTQMIIRNLHQWGPSAASIPGAVAKKPDAWVERMFNSMKNMCCRCNTKKAAHSYLGPNASVGERLCCKCYIASGGSPADWHPDCMAEADRLEMGLP